VAGFCEDGNELPGSINSGEYLDYPRNYQHLKENSVTGFSYLQIYCSKALHISHLMKLCAFLPKRNYILKKT
jgi:hypothetical protein